MKHPLKSRTIWGYVLMVLAASPTLGDPVWGVALDAGISDLWVAWAKLACWVAGMILVPIGRVMATGGLSIRRAVDD